MPMSSIQLPPTLPKHHDDGACNHLLGMQLPSVQLPATDGSHVDLTQSSTDYTVIYIYPMTGYPDGTLPSDNWNSIPGARGCTPQSCAFRDLHKKIIDCNATVFGLSNNTTAHQQEAAKRLELPFVLLSDEQMECATTLNLPTFTAGDFTLLKRVTLITKHNVIEKVMYPVFPTNENAREVLGWLQNTTS